VRRGTRDHARTPMRWTRGKYAGFSEAEPWIRADDGDDYCAETQQADENSVWSAYAALIALRKAHPALVYGGFEPADGGREDVFCYFRGDGQERFYIEVNLCARTIRRPKRHEELELVFSNYMAAGDGLQPYEANVYRVAGR